MKNYNDYEMEYEDERDTPIPIGRCVCCEELIAQDEYGDPEEDYYKIDDDVVCTECIKEYVDENFLVRS